MVHFQAISILSAPALQNVQGHDCLQLQQFWRTIIAWQRDWPDVRITYCPPVWICVLSAISIVQGCKH